MEIEKLYISLKNGLPLSSRVQVILLDEYNNIIDTLLNNILVPAAYTDNNNLVIAPYETMITLTETDFNNVKQIKSTSSFSTSSITEHIDIYAHYTMDVTLSAKFKKIIGN